MNQFKILNILVFDRIKEAGRLQQVLSRFGYIIKLRLGTHELSDSKNSRVGLIILVLGGNSDQWALLENELSSIGGIEVKSVSFQH